LRLDRLVIGVSLRLEVVDALDHRVVVLSLGVGLRRFVRVSVLALGHHAILRAQLLLVHRRGVAEHALEIIDAVMLQLLLSLVFGAAALALVQGVRAYFYVASLVHLLDLFSAQLAFDAPLRALLFHVLVNRGSFDLFPAELAFGDVSNAIVCMG
jgi:hypothetical protein